MKPEINTNLCWIGLSMAIAAIPTAAIAQSITPAIDGTGTIVIPQNNQFDITGGTLSGDGNNLFHSFQQFGVDSGQIANFLTPPAIQNVLGRVVGGDASVINGLVQLTGSQATLYLVNPAGIVFGSNASLNVPASFTATTATGIGFGTTSFDSLGNNNYATLIGHPTSFAFALSQPGAIVNSGNLSVNLGQNLTLMGGTILNNGRLSAPGGTITLAAVPGNNLVRLSQPGSLLSLEFQPLSPTAFPLTPATLPQLLTGGGVSNASDFIINANGQVVLMGSGLPVTSGDVVMGNQINSDRVLLFSHHNLMWVNNLPNGINHSGSFNLLAGNDVIMDDFWFGYVPNFEVSAQGSISIGRISGCPGTVCPTGPIVLTAGQDIHVQSIQTSRYSSGAILRSGGAVMIDDTISTGSIEIFAQDGITVMGDVYAINNGKLTLHSQGDIVVGSIRSLFNGKFGFGGAAIDIDTNGNLRVTSGGIQTIGDQPGTVRIRTGTTPFVVGDPTVNGTAGAIVAGKYNYGDPDEVTTIDPVRQFVSGYQDGNIQILVPTFPDDVNSALLGSTIPFEEVPSTVPAVTITVASETGEVPLETEPEVETSADPQPPPVLYSHDLPGND